jgi:hypothetical protein
MEQVLSGRVSLEILQAPHRLRETRVVTQAPDTSLAVAVVQLVLEAMPPLAAPEMVVREKHQLG